MGKNRISIGADRDNPFLLLDNDSIISAHINRSVDPTGATLAIGTLEVVFAFTGFAELFCPSDYPDGMTDLIGTFIYCAAAESNLRAGIVYGTKVYVSNDDNSLGIYYVRELRQTTANQFTLTAHDWVGALDNSRTPGITFGANWTNNTLLGSLKALIVPNNPDWNFGQPNAPDIVDISSRMGTARPDISTMPIRDGYIKSGSRREALQQLLFACNLLAAELPDGRIWIYEPTAKDISEIVPNRTYIGGDVQYSEDIRSIRVVEHSIAPQQDTGDNNREVVFDNQYLGNDQDITYWCVDGPPYFSYVYTGFREVVNYGSFFKLTGKGVLRAIPYLENTRELIWTDPDNINGSEISVNIPTVTGQFAVDVMARLKAYYTSSRQTIAQDMIQDDQAPGQWIRGKDPFKRDMLGMLTNINAELSSIVRARMTIETGYEPAGGHGYTNSIRLTGSGTWRVPEGVTRFAVTLIGGGSGGSSGLKGPNGKNPNVVTPPAYTVNDGGKVGSSGKSGKIYTIDVLAPAVSYSYRCGTGGAGGVECSDERTANPGSPGTETTFGPYTSAAGVQNDNGFRDAFTYKVYGAVIPVYKYTGGDTSGSGGWVFSGVSINIGNLSFKNMFVPSIGPHYYHYENGKQTMVNTPNLVPDFLYSVDFDYSSTGKLVIFPGAPGGAADALTGTMGTRGQGDTQFFKLGDGGAGATPDHPGINPMDMGEYYGWGGGPGCGGGAGGNAGFILSKDSWPQKIIESGTGGIGGNGGPGGPGAPGCIIIYY